MPRVGRAAFIAGTVAALQCGLFPSLDGLTEKSDASSGVDASDVAVVDAPVGDAAGRWCDSLSPAPTLCDDFDDQGPFSRWSGQFTRAGGSVTRDPSAFQSSPNALLALAPAAQTAGGAYIYLETTSTISKVHVAYDMRIDARDPAVGYAEVNYIRFDASTVPFSIYLRVFDNPSSTTTITSEAYLADGGIANHDLGLLGAPRFDAWTHMTIDLDLANAHTLSVTIDGNPAGSQTLESNLYAPGPARVTAGIGYTGYPTTGTWSIRYDNATIDWQ